MKHILCLTTIVLTLSAPIACTAQQQTLAVAAGIDFDDVLRTWDGFGVNYVETSQTYDYSRFPQDYGGFSILNDESQQQIIALTFGDDGLRPAIVKMFLDPLHQKEENGPYDHATTTASMRHFVKEGQQHTAQRGETLSVISTLYAPPAYVTKQNKLRGRDLRPDKFGCLSDYMADWAVYLREEGINIRYLSLHNEGEDWRRWPDDGGASDLMDKDGHDYNMLMSPETVTTLIKRLRQSLDERGLYDVGVTNGENTNWYRFWAWNYAGAIAKDSAALRDLALVTSHGFYVGGFNSPRWFAPHSNEGIEQLRRLRPELHAWTTSTAWNVSTTDIEGGTSVRHFVSNAQFLKEIHGAIYEAHVNAIIPWALIQRASQWNKPDPNPGCAFRVYDDGTWEVRKGYYYYKQMTTAGRPGMNVVRAWANDSDIAITAFSAAGIGERDAFVVTNWSHEEFDIHIDIDGCQAKCFEAFRTSGEEVYEVNDTALHPQPEGENFVGLGTFTLKNGSIVYHVPPMSATTFIAHLNTQHR